jgi:hypothetical protein
MRLSRRLLSRATEHLQRRRSSATEGKGWRLKVLRPSNHVALMKVIEVLEKCLEKQPRKNMLLLHLDDVSRNFRRH